MSHISAKTCSFLEISWGEQTELPKPVLGYVFVLCLNTISLDFQQNRGVAHALQCPQLAPK